MKHSKIAVLLAAMLLAGFSAEAQNFLFTDTSATGQVLYYDTLNGAARVVSPRNGGNYTGHTEPTGDIVIPDLVTWDGTAYAVRYIGERAFYNKQGITSVVIGDEVEEIGNYAFQRCSTMVSLTLGSSLTTIGTSAFNACTSLTEVTFPASLITIQNHAFNTTGINEFTVPSTVTTIGLNAFYRALNVVYTGTATGAPWGASGVNCYLNDSIYYNGPTMDTVVVAHRSITMATLPPSVVCIRAQAFENRTQLRRVTLPVNLHRIEHHTFHGCTVLDSVALPDSLQFVSSHAFGGCTSLTSIDLPVANYSDNTFSGCTSLASVTLHEGQTALGPNMFFGCASMARITLPSTITTLGESLFWNCFALDSVAIPSGVTVLSNDIFRGCSSLTYVDLPSTLTSIGQWAFYGCSSLTEFNIPDSVTSIGPAAFALTALQHMVIGGAVATIGNSSFQSCTALQHVVIGESVRSIGQLAFQNCTALDTVVWLADSANAPGQLTYSGSYVNGITNHAFTNCPSLRVLIIGDSVTVLPNYFFKTISSVHHLVLGASLQAVGYSSFDDLTALDTITCRSLVPPSAGRINSFWHVPYMTTVVEVPCEAIDDYRASADWVSFANLHTYGTGLTLTLAANNDDFGTVWHEGIHCDSTVTVRALPADGYFLQGWSDGGSGKTRVLQLNGDSSLTAFFAVADTFNITLTSTASAICIGGGIYLTGDTAVLKVIPPAYYRFDGWTDGDTSNPRRVCVVSDSAFTAIVTPVAVPHDTLYIIDTLVVEQYDTLTIHTDTTITVDTWEDILIHDTIIIDSVVTVEIHVTDSVITPNSELTTPNSPKTTISYTTAAGHALQFTINADGVSVTATQLYPGTAGQYDTLYVPDTVMHGGNAYAVTRIGYHAFYGLIRYVVLPPTVRVIADQAFYYGERMRYLGLNEGLDTIGTNAFYHCSVLDSIILPNSVRYIGSNAFQACFAMRKAVLPQGFKVINASTFYDCEQLHSVDFGDSLEVIGDYAFGDTHIDTITLPATVQSIGYHAFFYEWPTYPTQMVRLLGTVPPTTQSGYNNQRSGLLTSLPVRVPCEAIGTYMADPSWSMFPNLRSYGIGVEVSVSATTGGSARVMQHPDCDSTAIIAAIANNGYRFVGWSDGSTDNPRTVQLLGDSIFRAQFILFRPQIDVDIQGNGTVLGAGEYALNASVTLSALPAYGSYFLGWSGLTDSILIDNPLVFTANDDYSIMAHFGSGTPAPIYDVAVYLTDTILLAITDTLIVVDTTYDTIVYQNLIHDTTYIVNVIYDTVYIHDTVYVEPPVGLDDVVLDDVVLRNENGNIIVSSSREHTVVLYDVSGRRLAIGRGCSLSFGIPCSGVYLLRIDALPARRIMAIR